VRVPSPRLIRIGGILGGSSAEPGDPEFSVPGVLQPVIELSSPVDKIIVFGSASLVLANDSLITGHIFQRVGVLSGLQQTIVTFTKGMWAFDVTFHGAFAGTTNAAVQDALLFVDPDAATNFLGYLPRINGANQSWQGSFRTVFQRDGFGFLFSSGATVAGDSLVMTTSINARRLM
jgi:hypothetical protein